MCKKVAFQVFQPSLTILGSDSPILTLTLGSVGDIYNARCARLSRFPFGFAKKYTETETN